MIKVYIASKFHHGKCWKRLAEDAIFFDHPWFGITFNSRWFMHYVENVPDEPQFCKIGWEHDIEDVVSADVIILYAEPYEHLRGALVEVGAALAYGRYVITIGDHPDYGTWQYHANVHNASDMNMALQLIRCMSLNRIGEENEG